MSRSALFDVGVCREVNAAGPEGGEERTLGRLVQPAYEIGNHGDLTFAIGLGKSKARQKGA